MIVDLPSRTESTPLRRTTAPPSRRRRRRTRPTLRPPVSPTRTRTPAGVSAHPLLSEAERERRLAAAARALVRTIRACPAPGVAPFRTRDWLALAAVVAVPAGIVILVGLAAR